jgi:hypothetical protein
VPPPDSADASSEDTCDCDDPEVTSVLSSWSHFRSSVSSRSMGKFLIFVRDCGLAGLPAWQTKKKDC